MTRRKWITASGLAVAWAACRRKTEIPAEVFPATAPGGWRRTALGNLAVSESPDPVPRTAVDGLVVASYEGPGVLQARVYALAAEAVGFELAQRWRPSADTVFFSRGRFFVVVKWEGAERGALQQFVADLERRLPAPAGGGR